MIRSTAVVTAVAAALSLSLLGCGSDGGTGPEPRVPTSLEITPGLDTIGAIGHSVQLEATVRDQNGSAMSGASVSWQSLDTGVATVDSDARVVAVSLGTARIRATSGELTDEAAVVVIQIPALVALTVPDDTLAEGESVQLSAVVTDESGEEIESVAIGWESSDPTAATVDAAGRVTAVRGRAVVTITATAGEASSNTDIAVLGKIAFISNRTGNNEIFLMNSDGSGVEQMTMTATLDETMLDWSPDGSKIVFTADPFSGTDIYVMNADGSGATRVTENSATNELPAWSPDGSKIAFASDIDGDLDVYVMNPDGTGVVQLTNDAAMDSYPSWSPDGSKIAFTSGRASGGFMQVYVMNADGTGVTQLTTGSALSVLPVWSPDGSRIAFVSGLDESAGEVYVMNADGSGPVRLTEATGLDAPLSWSPDGSGLLIMSQRDGNLEIYVMNADGSGQRNLTSHSASDMWAKWRPRTAR